ncbi:MAG: SMP-30/gluconolactonase/LRE family protein, partial [Pseudomonadota bacterium]
MSTGADELGLFDDRHCSLGEGPLWHPGRGQLFWFDILGRKLLSRDRTGVLEWQFDQMVSAAGWIDRDTLLIASETALWRFDLRTGGQNHIAALEAGSTTTRPNDGRADPRGGFWIGTMGKALEPGAGAIYRFYRGEMRPLYDAITVPNAICFSPDGSHAYFTDTPTRQIMRVRLDADGWPTDAPEIFVDLTAEGLNPDGAVIDCEGALWNAQWGAARVARYLPDGQFDRAVRLPALHSSCPAFGGADLATLYVTSARTDIPAPDAAQGCVFAGPVAPAGLPEHSLTARNL